MKSTLINLCLIITIVLTSVSFSRAAGELTGIQYRNIKVAGDGKSFSMEIWAYSVEPAYATAAAPWSSFTIRMDLSFVGGATDIGTLGASNITYGLATSGSLTSSPPGGTSPKLGMTLTRGTGGELTTAPQRLATIVIPVTGGTGTITSATVAQTRPSPAAPGVTETYWTSSVTPALRRSLVVPQDTPLPVTLSSFNVRAEGTSTVNINWSTSSESKAKHFDIERSIDAKRWETIGNKASSGNSSTLLSYSFTDNTPKQGLNYYRLKMVDQDGSFALSRMESVSIGSHTAQVVSVYPNPTSDVLHLNTADQTGLKQVAILSASGATAYQSNTYPANGINVKNLSGGLYVVKVTHSDGTRTQHRLVITR